jgi:hypothetical protein
VRVGLVTAIVAWGACTSGRAPATPSEPSNRAHAARPDDATAPASPAPAAPLEESAARLSGHDGGGYVEYVGPDRAASAAAAGRLMARHCADRGFRVEEEYQGQAGVTVAVTGQNVGPPQPIMAWVVRFSCGA